MDGSQGANATTDRARRAPPAARIIFDRAYYLRQNPDVAAAGVDPFVHYLEIGWAEGRNPAALFDNDYYLEQNPDVAHAGVNPLVHYVSSGARERRRFSPLFDIDWYLAKNADVAAAASADPLLHYLNTGAAEGREVLPLFDAAWYLAKYPQAARARTALSHYAEFGAQEGLSPHPLFDGRFYLDSYEDIAAARINPLAHFLARGTEERRQPHPLFDAAWYLDNNADVANAGVNPLLHFIWNGAKEGRSPSPVFDAGWYARKHGIDGEANPLIHYLTIGFAQGLAPHWLFDAKYYWETYPDIAQHRLEPLGHYLQHGGAEGRKPHPYFDAGYYLSKNPEAHGHNPLLHYLRNAARIGASPNPLFDELWYRANNPDLGNYAVAFQHYIEHGAREHRAPHPLFDPHFYRRTNPDLQAAHIDLLLHYLEHGGREFRQPHPLFDVATYMASAPDLSSAGGSPLMHFVLVGAAEGRQPHPLFDVGYYLESAPEAVENPLAHYIRVGAAAGLSPSALFDSKWYARAVPNIGRENPLAHYVTVGAAEGRAPHPLFDPSWYARHVNDVDPASISLLTHYELYGAPALISPHPLFDPRFYLSKVSDPTAAANPLRHYLVHGGLDLTDPNPLFDATWYARRYPEFADAYRTPLEHYVAEGEALGFRPHPLFDPRWYVRINTTAAEHSAGALAHYLEFGGVSDIQPHALFDASYYRAKNPDIANAKINPLAHFVNHGWHERRDPHPLFSTYYYLRRNPDVSRSGVNPLIHYAARATLEMLQQRPQRLLDGDLPPARQDSTSLAELLREHAAFTSAGPDFEEFDPTLLQSDISAPDAPLLMAYYLPQFHPIAENDKFWGKGFTEWRQLARALPRFPGHYQPRIPRDVGFYNLLDEDVIARQAELAKQAGIGAFCYYYYWFNNRRVLEQPLELLLKSDVEMPFLLMWANENWTRTWDGGDSEVLLRQDYKPEDEGPLLADLARHFSDPRYVRIDGRPLIIIYNPVHIPESPNTIQRWRERLQREYGLNPLIYMAQAFGQLDPRPFGLDGSIEFPPHKLAMDHPSREAPDAFSADYTGNIVDYNGFVATSLGEDAPKYPLIKTIVPSWDNDPRRPNRGFTLEHATPAAYQQWLQALVRRALGQRSYGKPIVAINAWNEWAESAYLEPDVYYGSAYLNATARAYDAGVAQYNAERAERAKRPVTAIVPNYNHAAFLEERLTSIIKQTVPPAEIIFLDDCSSDNSLEVAKRVLSGCGIPHRIVPNERNSGGVFRQWMKGLTLASHDLIWIAESDDTVDENFLYHLTPEFDSEAVMAAFGRISYIDEGGAPLNDLDNYFNGLRNFSWEQNSVVPAYEAFRWDFALKNVIPNASGLVFRKPKFTDAQIDRLFSFRFAGDWYFYALMARGGAIAYNKDARSYFRLRASSTSRGAFFTEQHLIEHREVLSELRNEYALSDGAVRAHADLLAPFATGMTPAEVFNFVKPPPVNAAERPLRICIAALGFMVGGGELVPIIVANAMRARGHHVTYLILEDVPPEEKSLRARLRSDIPVVRWSEVRDPETFFRTYGFDIFNSHNVGWDWRLSNQSVDVPVPYVATLHGGYETVTYVFGHDHFPKFMDRNIKTWLYLTKRNAELLWAHGVPRDRFKPVFNAIPPFEGPWEDRAAFRAQHRIPQDALVGVLCSRAIEEKGWGIAIETVRRLAESQRHPVHLVLIGDGPYLETAQALARSLPNVTIMGRVEDPIRYFRCFDFGIFPTTYEGESFPLFLLECFAAGLPAITTDVGEIPEIMSGDTPGALVSSVGGADAIRDQMVRTLSNWLADPALFARLRENAGTTSNRFSIDKLADYYLDVFHGAISAHRR